MKNHKLILTLPPEMLEYLRQKAAPKFLNAQQVIKQLIAEEMIRDAERSAENG